MKGRESFGAFSRAAGDKRTEQQERNMDNLRAELNRLQEKENKTQEDEERIENIINEMQSSR